MTDFLKSRESKKVLFNIYQNGSPIAKIKIQYFDFYIKNSIETDTKNDI